jgi:uncharacterized RDD family membrane protein YckC
MSVEHPAAPLRRRLAAMVYEGILLFGVLVIAGYVFSVATQQRHALHGQTSMQVFVFLFLGAYFTYFWFRGGQTLAMKTWNIRVVGPKGERMELWRCISRYVLAWLWFIPPLLVTQLVESLSLRQQGLLVLGWVMLYALISRFSASRQFIHDRLCGSQLVSVLPKGEAVKAHADSAQP